MKPTSVLRSTAIAGILAGTGIAFATPAFATPGQTGSVAGMPFDLGPSPVGLPTSCSFPNDDANFVFLSGSYVAHESTNKNGDWGGLTAQGTAEFYEGDTPLFQGHLTLWEGGGNNAQGQNEGGFTLDYHGTGATGTLQIHVDGHMTTNANGTPTANIQHVNVTCA